MLCLGRGGYRGVFTATASARAKYNRAEHHRHQAGVSHPPLPTPTDRHAFPQYENIVTSTPNRLYFD